MSSGPRHSVRVGNSAMGLVHLSDRARAVEALRYYRRGSTVPLKVNASSNTCVLRILDGSLTQRVSLPSSAAGAGAAGGSSQESRIGIVADFLSGVGEQ